jgi:hypothetical protein
MAFCCFVPPNLLFMSQIQGESTGRQVKKWLRRWEMQTLLGIILDIIKSPSKVSWVCTFYIFLYYVVSYLCIRAEQKNIETSPWKKNKPLDLITSVIWVFTAAMLIWSLLELCIRQQMSLGYLVLYYFFFIFLFAFCYGLLEWHFTGMLDGVDASTWEAEFQYIIISIQTQTTLGYTRVRPNRLLTEVIACVQALLGLFFCIVFVARAVNMLDGYQK